MCIASRFILTLHDIRSNLNHEGNTILVRTLREGNVHEPCSPIYLLEHKADIHYVYTRSLGIENPPRMPIPLFQILLRVVEPIGFGVVR